MNNITTEVKDENLELARKEGGKFLSLFLGIRKAQGVQKNLRPSKPEPVLNLGGNNSLGHRLPDSVLQKFQNML